MLNDTTICAVYQDDGPRLYTYMHGDMTEDDMLKDAAVCFIENAETFRRNAETYRMDNPSLSESWEKRAVEYDAMIESLRLMTFSEFLEMERDYYISKPLEEVTEEDYHDAMNVLPPEWMGTMYGVHMFTMSEHWTGPYTSQYARHGGKYYRKMVDCSDRSTWIHNFI